MADGPTPIMFLPGMLNDGALWGNQIAGLRDCTVPYVADLTQHDNVQDMAAATLAAAPGRFALAALSMGGYVAFEMLRQAPERIMRLALIDTRASLDSAEEARRREGLIQLAEVGEFKGVTSKLLPTLLDPANVDEPELGKVITGMAERVGKEAFIRQQKAIMNRPDSTPLLAGINVPTVVVCGRNDRLTPVAEHQDMADRIPGADLVILAQAGHMAPLERPEGVTQALRAWLTG